MAARPGWYPAPRRPPRATAPRPPLSAATARTVAPHWVEVPTIVAAASEHSWPSGAPVSPHGSGPRVPPAGPPAGLSPGVSPHELLAAAPASAARPVPPQ